MKKDEGGRRKDELPGASLLSSFILHPSSFSLFLCLLFFALLLHNLDRQPLWWDEGYSLYLASLSPADLARATAADVHPPGYYLLLRGWVALAGPSPFSARLFSALAAVPLIPLLYVGGRGLTNGQSKIQNPKSKTGWVGALLAATSPFILHHGREVRMYGLGMTLAALSALAFMRLRRERPVHPLWWVVYVLSTGLGLYSHYAFILIPLAQSLTLVLAWWRPVRGRGAEEQVAGGRWQVASGKSKIQNPKSKIRVWLAALGGVALLFAPWLLFAAGQLRALQANRLSGQAGQAYGVAIWLPAARHFLSGYRPTGHGLETAALIGLLILMLVGLLTLWRRRPGIALSLGLTVGGAALAIALVRHTPEEGVGRVLRLVFPAVPALLWLTGAGVVAILSQAVETAPTHYEVGLRRLTFPLLLLLLLVHSQGLVALYQAPLDEAEDYRPLVAQVQQLARPGDALLTAYEWQDGYFASYAPGLPMQFIRNSYTAESAAGLLTSIFQAHPRLWLVLYGNDVHNTADPLHAWLGQNAALALDRWYGRSQLALFVYNGPPPTTWSKQVSLAGGILVDFNPTLLSIQPGDTIGVDLRWQAAGSLDCACQVFVHLRDAGGRPIAQSDHTPAGGLAPTTTWTAGQPILDRHALLIPLDAPPGNYTLYAGLYDPATLERLPLVPPAGCDTADSVCLGQVALLTLHAKGVETPTLSLASLPAFHKRPRTDQESSPATTSPAAARNLATGVFQFWGEPGS